MHFLLRKIRNCSFHGSFHLQRTFFLKSSDLVTFTSLLKLSINFPSFSYYLYSLYNLLLILFNYLIFFQTFMVFFNLSFTSKVEYTTFHNISEPHNLTARESHIWDQEFKVAFPFFSFFITIDLLKMFCKLLKCKIVTWIRSSKVIKEIVTKEIYFMLYLCKKLLY